MKGIVFGIALCLASFLTIAGGNNNPASVAYVNSKIAELLAIVRPPLAIGQQAFGGTIFWLDSTGQHGLIVTSFDFGLLEPWGINNLTLANADGIGGGQSNTILAIANQAIPPANNTNFAVDVCQKFAVQANGQTLCAAPNDVCYADWYLPSKSELNQLYLQRNNITGLQPFLYWSSTEIDAANAWQQNMGSGAQASGLKVVGQLVRCIRQF